MEESKYHLRQLAASLLVYSISKIFPNTQINGFGPTKKGFFCDCQFSSSMDHCLISLIQEQLQRLISEAEAIESVEMMRENAAQLFQHKNLQVFAAQALNASANIIELARVGNDYAICPGPHPKTTRELGVVKLYLSRTDSATRIEGILFPNRKKLKEYQKKLSIFRKHEEIGRELCLFSDLNNRMLWTPRGEWIRELLIDFWKRSHRVLGYEVFGRFLPFAPGYCLPFEFGYQLSEISMKERLEPTEPEGLLFDLQTFTSDSVWTVGNQEEVIEKLISYLHFIKRMVRMVPIECIWIFNKGDSKRTKDPRSREQSIHLLGQVFRECGLEPDLFLKEKGTSPYFEARYQDALGRVWPGPRIELIDGEIHGFNQPVGTFVAFGSLFRSLEAFIAILLEATKGLLPFWLAPEQVRVIPVRNAEDEYAQQIVEELKNRELRVYCDKSTFSLSERVYLAKMLKIPFIVIVGENERKSGTVALNCQYEGEETQELSIVEFMRKLDEQNRDNLDFAKYLDKDVKRSKAQRKEF